MALRDREWRLVREEARPGPLNMALDEVAAETAGAGGPRTLRVYRWEPSTLSLGYRQAPETVDWDFCDREGVTVTRRPTGGGGIYHDARADISYSVVAPADEVPGDLMETYALFCEPVLEAFERLGVAADFAEEEQPAVHEPACYLRAVHPAHDVVVDGRKVSGNAQYRRKDSVVQHGSLMFDLRPERHLGVFETTDVEPHVDPDTLRKRVTTIREHADVDRETAVGTLEDALAEWADVEEAAWSDDEGGWTDDELERARALAEEKYASEAWNRRREDPTG